MSGTPQRPRLISNLKVLELLQEQSERQASNKHKQFVHQKTIEYIESTNAKSFGTAEHAQQLLDQLVEPRSAASLKLMPAEALQVVNTVPTEAVEAHLIVENPDEKRLNDEVVEELLQQIQRHQKAQPKPPPTHPTATSATNNISPAKATTLNGNHHGKNNNRQKRRKR